MINGLTLVINVCSQHPVNNIKAINDQSLSVCHTIEHGRFHYDSVGSKCQASSRYLLLSMSVFIVFVSVCWCCHTNGLWGLCLLLD